MQRVRSLVSGPSSPFLKTCSPQVRRLSSSPSSRQSHDPLRILFCGADEFSIYSLRALNALRLEQPEKVASIDVVCKTDKRVGRGLKRVQAVPIKKAAVEELGLDVHQIDTFTRWEPPKPKNEPVNLIVAVSFGLLVPPRILNTAKYGGLNVHPSMLPDLRGPAPLHHTLLERLETTGVTLQTLHPKHFDQGLIVDQTPQPGLPIPDLENATPELLLNFVGPLGAEMLRANICRGTFTETRNGTPPAARSANTNHHRHAPKITSVDRRIEWDKWNADDIVLRDRVLGRLWDERIPSTGRPNDSDIMDEPYSRNRSFRAESFRTIYHGFTKHNGDSREFLHGYSEQEIKDIHAGLAELNNGSIFVFRAPNRPIKALMKCHDGSFVMPQEVTPEGSRRTQAQEYYETCDPGDCIRISAR